MLKDNDADCQSPAAAFELPLHRSQGTMVRPKTPNQDETAAKPKLPAAAQVFALDARHLGASTEASFLLT
jgi:hypothetical protein